ncbi:CocE/NonD family hydrolase [Albidovulum sp.]|uniref:CocE/NonD family hydrolase n=1 Tax=Albidovulum sp. TaxID=1872424 RepID=UPI0039B85F91
MKDHRVIENEWIVLPDGTRLAARIWMPAGAGPFPAVLEYLPYRKRNGTAPRDESTYPVFAEAGIAGVRVDIRGSGESDGIIDGEYTPRELSDGCDVIAWIARQPWSNGRVGMMGISWGGFNSLQIAAMKPPALKAVISIASTVDRYNDDIHYKNGCHLSAQLSWAATMLAYQTRAPDPAIVGERWRDMWLERLEGEPELMQEWLSHQRRDAFWKHGSICEDFVGYDVPSLVIAGWADGYRTTPFKAAEGAPRAVRALVGPWIHKYPHFAWPKPRWDFHTEAIAWWNRWLTDGGGEADDTPGMRAYILDGPHPSLWRERDPGYWVAMDEWRAPRMLTFGVNRHGCLATGVTGEGVGPAVVHSPLDTGTASGEWFTLRPDAEMAGDQRGDDAGSLVFETLPLGEELVLLGQPEIRLAASCAGRSANLVARLVDVHPDGTAMRIALGVLNLAHRAGNETPAPVPAGEPLALAIRLDACGYRLAPGHRLRLAISTAYWPTVLPQPEDPAVTVDTGNLTLDLPLLGAHRRIFMPEPANPDPLPHYEELGPGRTGRRVERDLTTGTTRYHVLADTGCTRHPGNGQHAHDIRKECWTITAGDPLSMAGEAEWTCVMGREGWEVTTKASLSMRCTKDEWLLSSRVEALERGNRVFERSRDYRIPRDFM